MQLEKQEYTISKATLEKIFRALQTQGSSLRRMLEAEDSLVFEVGNQHLPDKENAQNK